MVQSRLYVEVHRSDLDNVLPAYTTDAAYVAVRICDEELQVRARGPNLRNGIPACKLFVYRNCRSPTTSRWQSSLKKTLEGVKDEKQ